MLQSSDCNVVLCRDRNCKLCSTSNTGTLQSQAYIVYTCESTKCKLCREETDVLLDLFCPFNTVEEIAEMTRKLNNTAEAPWNLDSEGFTTTTGLQICDSDFGTSEGRIDLLSMQPAGSASSDVIHTISLETPGQVNDRHTTNLEIMQNLQPVDESLLTNLERELQVDQLKDLPELTDICDLISK